MHTKLWSENLKERDHFRDQARDGKIILEKYSVKLCTELKWFSIGSDGGHW
jgi:hypothetical protein